MFDNEEWDQDGWESLNIMTDLSIREQNWREVPKLMSYVMSDIK